MRSVLLEETFEQRTVVEERAVDVVGMLEFAEVHASGTGAHEHAAPLHRGVDVEPAQVTEPGPSPLQIGCADVLLAQEVRQAGGVRPSWRAPGRRCARTSPTRRRVRVVRFAPSPSRVRRSGAKSTNIMLPSRESPPHDSTGSADAASSGEVRAEPRQRAFDEGGERPIPSTERSYQSCSHASSRDRTESPPAGRSSRRKPKWSAASGGMAWRSAMTWIAESWARRRSAGGRHRRTSCRRRCTA